MAEDDDGVIEMDADEDFFDVLGNGAVMKEIEREAPDEEIEYGRPEVGDQCVIAYDGYVVGCEGEERQEKMCHRKYHFTLGSDDEIKGWTDALETMYQGEMASVTIKPHRAYGKMGAPPEIPGNVTVCFRLELLSFTKKSDVSEERDGTVLKHVIVEGEGPTDIFSLPNKRCDIYYAYKLRLPYDGTCPPLREDDDAEWLAEDHEHGPVKGLRKALETMRRGERARFTMYGSCHGVRGIPECGLKPRDRCVYEIKMKCWVESVECVYGKDGAVVKRIMKAIHHTKADPPDEFDRVRVQGHVSLSSQPDVVVAVLGDRGDFDNSYGTWKLRDATHAEIMKLLGDGSSCYDDAGFKTQGGWFDDAELPQVPLCPGLDEAVKSMRIGEIADVEIRADFGYKASDGVPAHAVNVNLDAHLQLLSYDKEKLPFDMKIPREIIELAEQSKESGNAQVRKGNFAQAIRRYKRCGDCVKCITMNEKFFADPLTGEMPKDDPMGTASEYEKRKAKNLEAAAASNKAMCHLKLFQFKDAEYDAKAAVEADSHNVKARFRLASARLGLNRLRAAEKDLVLCLKDEPYNKEIQRCLVGVRKKLGVPINAPKKKKKALD